MAANTLMIFVKVPGGYIDEVWNPQDYVDAMTAENEQKGISNFRHKSEISKIDNERSVLGNKVKKIKCY